MSQEPLRRGVYFDLKPDSSADGLTVHSEFNLFCGAFLWIRALLDSHEKERFFSFSS